MTTLKKGDEGQDVKELQEALVAKGYDVGAIDGVFGGKTELALIKFQKSLGVTPTGILGSWVASKLLSKGTSKGKTITITAGHNNKDPGAVNGKRTEAAIVTDFRNLLSKKLKESGNYVKTDGEGDMNYSLSDAVKLIKGSNIAIEFHLNAAANPKAGGVEVLAHSKHKKVSQAICKSVSEVLGIKPRGPDGGWKPENSGQHSRLAFVSGGGLIVELFFISNDEELSKYDTNKEKLVDAVAKAILDNI